MVRALEIVSEAARRLPEEFRSKHSTLPWKKKIMGVGNVYRHSYEQVMEDYVWTTVHEHLDTLFAVVTAEVEALGRDS